MVYLVIDATGASCIRGCRMKEGGAVPIKKLVQDWQVLHM